MKYLVIITLIFLFSIPIFAQAPDTLWTKLFRIESSSGEGVSGSSVQQTEDGGFIISGNKQLEDLAVGLQLIKTDSIGDTLWMRSIENVNFIQTAETVIETFDGNYVTVGISLKDGGNLMDVWFTKWSSSGVFLGERIYDKGGTNDFGGSIAQTADSGFIIISSTEILDGGGLNNHDIWLLRTDIEGDTLWTKTYGGAATDVGVAVQQTEDGGYIITGRTHSFGAGVTDAWFIKTDSFGDTLWTKTYGGVGVDVLNSTQLTQDGGYISTGSTRSFGAGNLDAWLVKTDSFGDTLWTKTYGGVFNDGANSVQQTQDGGFVLTGSFDRDEAGGQGLGVITTDSLGNEIWSQFFISASQTTVTGRSIQQLTDGGYIVLGNRISAIGLTPRLWLIRLAPDPPPDTTLPQVTIENLVQDSTYTTHRTNIEYSLFDEDPGDSISYSLDGGLTRTYIGWGDLINGIQSEDGLNKWLLYAEDAFGNIGKDSVEFSVDTTTIGIEDNTGNIPENYLLSQNYPNPFNPETVIRYSIPQAEEVSLVVYNLIGEKVALLINGNMPAGNHRVTWDASNVSSGIYFYRLQAGDFVQTRKMVLLK